MLNSRTRWLLAAAAALAVVSTAHASSPKFFQAATQSDFLKGDVENLSIDSHGQLVLGSATELVYETAAPFLWCMLGQPDGSVFVGTGNEGKIFKIDPQGKGSLFFDSPELEVHALAAAPNGGLYAATSPDGKIYRIDRDGKGTVLFDPGTKYIWSLAVDQKGVIYAGTGEKGLIYKITPDGKGTVFYKTSATHVTSLAVDRAGNVIAGTGSPGKIMRIDAEGKAFVLLDSPFQEIKALRFDDKGMLFAAAQSGRAPSGAAPATPDLSTPAAGNAGVTPVVTVSAEITSIAVVDVTPAATTATPARPDRGSLKGGVYRIAPDGVWDQLWQSNDESPYDIAFDRDGALLIATGAKGKMYRLEGDPLHATLIGRAGAQQVTAFSRDSKGRLYFATANPGKLFRLSSDRAPRGTYVSEPRDAQTVASWGTISWRGVNGNGRIEVSTRSGNTETPDDGWSQWSAPYTNAVGSAITSPKARYIQWRVALTGKDEGPILTSITAAYLQRNLRPQVHSITVYPPGIVFQKPYSTGEPDLAGFEDQTTPERKMAAAAAAPQTGTSGPALGRRAYQKGLQTLIWKADDENEDELLYDIMYRREGEPAWKTLRRGVTESILVWDTTTVPNGTYFVKIVASDSPSNPPSSALAGELDSTAFVIDNTPPTIAITSVKVEGGHTVIGFDVKDDNSPVDHVEISQDGQRWRAVFPTDGIADSREEHYLVTVDGELGDRGLTIRAADTMANVETAHVDAPRRR
jgi:sugar lactone lactonase YvrE